MQNKFIFLFVFVLFNIVIYAQTISKGNYTSDDDNYTVFVEQKGDDIYVIESNKSNVYRKKSNYFYYNIEPKYNTYYLRFKDGNHFYSGKTGAKEFLFTLSNTNTSEEIVTSAGNCPLYDKYLKLSQEDSIETQAWSFCGGAALAKCTYNAKGSQEYIQSVVEALKSIIVDQDKCPCEDVITKSEWNSVSVY